MTSAHPVSTSTRDIGNTRLYARFAAISVRSQLQYRGSFIMSALGGLFSTGIEFLGIWALFHRFGSINGWRLPEVGVFYGVVNVAYAIAEASGRGFDTFSTLVKSGDFDRILLRPRSTALQVAGGELQLMRFGRLIQGLVVLLVSVHNLGQPFDVVQVVILGEAIAGGTALFLGLFILQATMSFWTVESLEIMNTLTYGGTETAQYPLTIYRPWFRRFFTFVVPLACANYLPLSRVLPAGHFEVAGWVSTASPLIGFVFLYFALRAWNLGVRHYHSTGC